MKSRYSNILKVLMVIAIVVVIVVANVSHKNANIRSVSIKVDYLDNDTLVTAEQLHDAVMMKYRDINMHTVGEVDLDGIREVVRKNPFVDEADISLSVSADVLVHVRQRSPLVRVYTQNAQFYLDKKGRYMPVSEINNQRVIVANGHFIKKDFACKPADLDIEALTASNPKAEKYDIVRIYRLAKYIDSHKKAKALFDQIYLNSDGDLEIVPKLGNHVVLIGNNDNLDEKFENLYALYEKGFSKTGWDKYSLVNLKFSDQIICTKKQ